MSALGLADFDFVRGLVRDRAAIVLEPGKEYLVETRLTPVAARAGFASLAALVAAVRRLPSDPLASLVVEALTTNETYFFRDFHPFEALRATLLPELIAARRHLRRLSVWCAACSTGQEPYSLAMLIRENFPELAHWHLDILGTDLNTAVLSQAEAGRYNQIEINRGLPAPYLVKYFEEDRGTATWILRPEIRRMVQFRPLNLIAPWPTASVPYDLVFIRNVMIYFDVETKRTILQQLRRHLQPDGSLFLGSSETTLNLDSWWSPVTAGSTVVYRPAFAQAAGHSTAAVA